MRTFVAVLGRVYPMAGPTVVCALAVLSPVLGSVALELTCALLVIEPALRGLMWTVTVAPAPFAMVPSAQVTVPADCVQLPWVGVADSYVTPPGSVSVRLTPVALEGPALWTESV